MRSHQNVKTSDEIIIILITTEIAKKGSGGMARVGIEMKETDRGPGGTIGEAHTVLLSPGLRLAWIGDQEDLYLLIEDLDRIHPIEETGRGRRTEALDMKKRSERARVGILPVDPPV